MAVNMSFKPDSNYNLGLFSEKPNDNKAIKDLCEFFKSDPYRGNASTLMAAIPPDEIWRFFVDGCRQSMGYKFLCYLRNFIQPDDFILSAAEFFAKYLETISELKTAKMMLSRANIPVNSLTHVSIINFLMKFNSWISFEMKETGYLRAMVSQLPTILSGVDISLEDLPNNFADKLIAHIKKLHQGTTRGVSGLLEDPNRNSHQEAGHFRNKNGIGLPLMEGDRIFPANISPAGFLELVEKIKESGTQDVFLTIYAGTDTDHLFIIGDHNQKTAKWLQERSKRFNINYLLAQEIT